LAQPLLAGGFLPRRLLIKTPKLHFADSRLAATLAGLAGLAGLAAEDWNTHRERLGHLLESWVAQQITTQAGWTDPDLRFWHYRDKPSNAVRTIEVIFAVPLARLWDR
jgi:hypothetical protein